MLTPTERAWLDEQRTKVVQQTDEADVWSTQVLLLTATRPPWWRRWSHARQLARARGMERLWDDRALRTDVRLTAFLNVYNVTAGETRGPIPTDGWNMSKSTGGKAPNTGSNSTTKRDDKATADGKPVKVNRPHVDRDKD